MLNLIPTPLVGDRDGWPIHVAARDLLPLLIEAELIIRHHFSRRAEPLSDRLCEAFESLSTLADDVDTYWQLYAKGDADLGAVCERMWPALKRLKDEIEG